MSRKEISEKQRLANIRRAEHLRKMSADPSVRELRKETGRRVMRQLHSDPEFQERLKAARAEVGVTDRMRENGRVMMKQNRRSPPKGQWGNGERNNQCDPRLTSLSAEQRKVYKKLLRYGIGKEEALAEAMKP